MAESIRVDCFGNNHEQVALITKYNSVVRHLFSDRDQRWRHVINALPLF